MLNTLERKLIEQATVLYDGDEEAAAAWSRTPLDVLGGNTPREHVGTEMGARDVKDLVGRLKHGVFS